MEFLQPEHLSWLAVLPVVFALWRVSAGHRRKAREQFEDFVKVARVSRISGIRREAARVATLLLAVVAVVLAMARPRLDLERTRPIYRKQDVVLMLDASLSMLARDVHPSRMERAKEEIRTFIGDRGALVDRIGLVTFAGTSVITSYLTSDPGNILFYLDFMEVVPRISYGTNIGAALNNAMTLVRTEEEVAAAGGLQVENQNVFLLLADGENYGEPLDPVLDEIVAAGIPVFAIGIGSDDNATIPIQVDGEEFMLADDEGNLVSAGFDESSLRQIATATGGSYYRSHSGAELSRIVAQLLEGEREVVGQEVVVEPVDLYPHLTLAAVVLLASMLLL